LISSSDTSSPAILDLAETQPLDLAALFAEDVA
jgi:hypothetical protein